MTSKLFAIAATALLMPACAAERLVPAEIGTFNAPLLKQAVDHVRVVQNPDSGEPTTVLAVLDIHEDTGNQDLALRALKERAALLGADAIVGVEFHHEDPVGGSKEIETHLSGVAVRSKRVLVDRPYTVLGPVKVDAAMGQEEQGLRALEAKAGAMHADLLVDVHFHHDESSKDEATHLSGVAIKYR